MIISSSTTGLGRDELLDYIDSLLLNNKSQG